MTDQALKNITVLDMTEAMAGPYAGMMLGDLGAEVIKIERPGKGDMSRGWGPPFIKGESTYFLSVNRNKKSLTLNLKHPAAQDVFHKLVRQADIFLVNVPRLESLQRLNADYDTLNALNPGLIYCAISGYGHTGPYAGRSGYDIAAQGESGLMAITGEPGMPPLRYPVPLSDMTAGIYTVVSALAALVARADSGQGQFIDTALLDSQTAWLGILATAYFATGERPRKLGNVHPNITPYQTFEARDKYISVAVGTERLWERFCEVLEIGETIGADPRFHTNAERLRHRQELTPRLQEILLGQDADYWLERFRAVNIPCGPINEVGEILNDPHIAARGMIVEQEHPVAGAFKAVASPLHLSETPPTYRLPPPLLGQHTDAILAGLGFSDAEIAALHDDDAV